MPRCSMHNSLTPFTSKLPDSSVKILGPFCLGAQMFQRSCGFIGPKRYAAYHAHQQLSSVEVIHVSPHRGRSLAKHQLNPTMMHPFKV